MKFDRTFLIERVLRRPAVGVVAGITVFAAVMSGTVHADPSEDGVAKLNELSRQAEQLTEAMHTAQLDLDNKLQAQAAAEKKHSDDLARADAAKGQLATYQGAVDKFAAAVYMGGRTDGLNAILTAGVPARSDRQDGRAKVMATEMSAQMQNYRRVNEEAVRAEADSAVGRRRQDRRRTGRRGPRRPAAQAVAVAGPDRDRQVAVCDPDPRPAGPRWPPRPSRRPRSPGAPASDALPNLDAPPLRRPHPPEAPAPEAAARGRAVDRGGSGEGAIAVQAALTRIGDPYVWGGGPNQFDCPAWSCGRSSRPASSAAFQPGALAAGGQPVSMSDIQPGDVSYYSDASHSAIYIGDGMMVHADVRRAGAGGADEQRADLQHPALLTYRLRRSAILAVVLVGQLLAAAILLGAGRHRPPQPRRLPRPAPLVVGDGRVVRLISLGGTGPTNCSPGSGADRRRRRRGGKFWGTDWDHEIVVIATGSDPQFIAHAGLDLTGSGPTSPRSPWPITSIRAPPAGGRRIVFARARRPMSASHHESC